MQGKAKNTFTRSPWRVMTACLIVIVMIVAMVLSYAFMSGGDRPNGDVGDTLIKNDLWSKTLAYANRAENKASLRVEDSLINVDNGFMALELDKTSPYLSKVFGSESGKVLFLSLPTVKARGFDRDLMLSDTQWTVPMNTAYSASASFTASLTGEGKEEEFVALRSFTVDDKNTLSDWSTILGGCKMKLGEGYADLTVDGSTSPYFGAGDLEIDLTAIPDGAIGCVRLKIKGSGVTDIEVNYSSVYDTIRLQGVASASPLLGEDWTYVTIPVTDGNFVGRLYTLYFRLSASLDAALSIESVEIGYVDSYKAPLEVNNLCTAYADRYILASTITALGSFSPDLLWTETVIPRDILSQIEIVSEGSSAYYKPDDMTLEGVDYTVFHFTSGEAAMLLPISDALTGRTEISLSENGKVTVKTYLDPEALKEEGGKVDVSYRMNYVSSELLHDFSNVYNEETRILTDGDVKVGGGTFDGYDSDLGRYVFTCDKNGSLDLTLTSKDSRYVYLDFRGGGEYITLRNAAGNKLPLTVVGEDGGVVGVYLESGEEMTLSVTSLSDGREMMEFLDTLGYKNAAGKEIEAVFTSAKYLCSSDLYTEIKYMGATHDGAADVTLTLIAFTDGNAPVYSYDLDISFKRTVTLSTLTEDLCLFSFDRNDKTGLYYTDVSDGVSFKSEKDMNSNDNFTLSPLSPAIAVTSTDGRAVGIVINSFSSTANIVPLSSVLHAGYNENSIFISGTGDLVNGDSATFGLGDHIRLKGVISDSSETAEELIARIRSAYGNGYITVAERGAVVESVIPTVKMSSSGTAAFNVRGGTETLPVRVEGLQGYVFPTVKVNGVPYTPAGYTPYIDPNGTVGFVFSVPCNSRIDVAS